MNEWNWHNQTLHCKVTSLWLEMLSQLQKTSPHMKCIETDWNVATGKLIINASKHVIANKCHNCSLHIETSSLQLEKSDLYNIIIIIVSTSKTWCHYCSSQCHEMSSLLAEGSLILLVCCRNTADRNVKTYQISKKKKKLNYGPIFNFFLLLNHCYCETVPPVLVPLILIKDT